MTKITKTSDTSLDAAQCGLNSFLDLLPQRTPLLGQCSVSYERFRRVHLRDLRPVAALECTVAENLIANEWELQQLRRMLNRVYAHILADQIEAAAFKTLKQTHEDKLDEDWQAWVSSGKNQEDWEEEPFDFADAEAHAAELAQLAR